MAHAQVLLVDDDDRMIRLTRDFLRTEGYAVETARNGRQALARLAERRFDLMVCDVVMPDIDGLELLRRARDGYGDLEVIVMSAYGGVEAAVRAMRGGAYTYVTKPLQLDLFSSEVRHSLRRRLGDDTEPTGRARRQRFGSLVGQSPAMQRLYGALERVAPTDGTVLLLGATGTGKELAAREVHARSRRRDAPFVAVNCGGLPQNLLASELFGHVRGAFTGAVRDKVGVFEAADGGTLFLDEIGNMSLETQITLLRVLQERAVRKVGTTVDRKIDVRVIAATNADLHADMDAGRFRPDLYYRLISVVIDMPPLSERVEDIPLLAEHFLKSACERHSFPMRTLSKRSYETLCAYPWPGNVRELEQAMEHCALLSERTLVGPSDLPQWLATVDAEPPIDRVPSLREVERLHIDRVLKMTRCNISKTARLLGVPRASLYRKLKRHGLHAPATERAHGSMTG